MREIKLLIERARKSLRAAELLTRENDFEASVSRSYYAMFYAAEAVLLTKALKFSSHKSVISQFGEHFIKPGIFDPKQGRNLSKAFEKRLIGDYSFAMEIGEETARSVYADAKEFIAIIEGYLKAEGLL